MSIFRLALVIIVNTYAQIVLRSFYLSQFQCSTTSQKMMFWEMSEHVYFSNHKCSPVVDLFGSTKYMKFTCMGDGKVSDLDSGMVITIWNEYRHCSSIEGVTNYLQSPQFSFIVQLEHLEKFYNGECIPIREGLNLQLNLTKMVNFVQRSRYPTCHRFDFLKYVDYLESTSPGNKVIPGLGFLGKGFDITKDLISGEEMKKIQRYRILRPNGYFPFTAPNFEDSKWFQGENTNVYPSQTQSEIGSENHFSDKYSYQRAIAVSLGIDTSEVTKAGPSAAASMAVSSEFSTTIKSNNVRIERKFEHLLYSIQYDPDDLFYTRQFEYDVMKLFHSKGNKYLSENDVELFIGKYGTHIITEVTLGGSATMIQENSACSTEEERSLMFKSNICARLETGLHSEETQETGSDKDEHEIDCKSNNKLGVDVSSGESSSVKNGESSWSIKIEGGDRSLCTKEKCDLYSYEKTIGLDNAEVIDFKLKDISFILSAHRPREDFTGKVMTEDNIQILAASIDAYILRQQKPNQQSVCLEKLRVAFSVKKCPGWNALLFLLFVIIYSTS